MKVIVTGGAGFIGSALTLHLHAGGADVVVVDKLTYAANPASLAHLAGRPRFELAREDICNAAAMVALFERVKPDRVYHLAAESHVDRSITGPQAFLETNPDDPALVSMVLMYGGLAGVLSANQADAKQAIALFEAHLPHASRSPDLSIAVSATYLNLQEIAAK